MRDSYQSRHSTTVLGLTCSRGPSDACLLRGTNLITHTHFFPWDCYRSVLLARSRADSRRHFRADHSFSCEEQQKMSFAYACSNNYNRSESFLVRTHQGDLASSNHHSANVFATYITQLFHPDDHLPISRLPTPTPVIKVFHITPTNVAAFFVRTDPHKSPGPGKPHPRLLQLLSYYRGNTYVPLQHFFWNQVPSLTTGRNPGDSCLQC